MNKYFFQKEEKTIEANSIEEAIEILNNNLTENVSNNKEFVSSKQKKYK
jgi:hypothetical protein